MSCTKAKETECDLLLIDGKHLFWRSASATSLDLEQNPTGGVYTFIRALTRVHERFGGQIVVCWEGGSRHSLERTKLFPRYKDKGKLSFDKKEILKQMSSQIDILIDLLSVLGIPQAKAKGWEADDAIATLAHRMSKEGKTVAIFSGDSDLTQCINENVFMVRPVQKDLQVVTKTDVKDWLGVKPQMIPTLKALTGDTSDNIPGVKGVGKMAGSRLVDKFKSIEKIIKATQNGGKPEIPRFTDSAWQALKEAVESGQLMLAFELAKVNKKAKVKISWSTLDKGALIKELMNLKFVSLLGTREIYRLCRLSGEL